VLAKRVGARQFMIDRMIWLGWFYGAQQKFESVESIADQCDAEIKRVEDPHIQDEFRDKVLTVRIELCADRNQFDKAISYVKKQIEYVRQIGSTEREALAWSTLAMLYSKQKRWSEMTSALIQCHNIASQMPYTSDTLQIAEHLLSRLKAIQRILHKNKEPATEELRTIMLDLSQRLLKKDKTGS
jgi:hypothetical protein